MMFAQSLIKDKDVTKLEALELALPYESPVSEKVYEQVVKLKLMANYSTYKEGSRVGFGGWLIINQALFSDKAPISTWNW